MRYIVSYQTPHHHFVDIECIYENNNEAFLDFQLPSWRPGRYETANFAKNVKAWRVEDKNGKALPFQKTSKDCWRVKADAAEEVHVKFSYYAYQLDAGACWLDDHQLYINGVHCFPFIPGNTAEPCILELVLPENYQIACGLREIQPNVLFADSYDTLVDSPLIASASLKHQTYTVGENLFHIWIQGECKPDWEKMIQDFTLFSKAQLQCMKEVPFEEYHFLIQVLPHRFYHGVEHINSTVLALGPGYDLMNSQLYPELLGVASHELFHAWNVKSIRPAEMIPYDYTKENYSRMGFVYEGVTTYYGDLFLYRSGVFTEIEYFQTLNAQLQKHFDNPGRFNLSVADASFDTWLDGYVEGVPGRKTSIYTEGCLLAFMVDVMIRRSTGNQKSLDDIMTHLYFHFAQKKKGYTEADYLEALETISGTSFVEFFNAYVFGTRSFDAPLTEISSYIGLQFLKEPSKKYHERELGFRLRPGSSAIIGTVMPDSVAFRAGLSSGDEIIAINNIKISGNFREWVEYFSGEKISLDVHLNGEIRKVELAPDAEKYFANYQLKRMDNQSPDQQKNFQNWSNILKNT